MASADDKENEFEDNKVLISSLAQEDGKLVSPIDLTLDNTKHLQLDRLKWMNFGNVPVKMKLTNTGETVIISGKWSKNRPYLCGGPLNGNYVFSQIHFHWGSDEHEGSEHTVRGISYPMEVHVVFYKTRYLTQEAALKKDDGVIIIVYLVKLQDKSTPALRWLANHLGKVEQPQTSVPLPLSPLSALLVPFNTDYLMYWGLLVTHRCSHTMLWLVSRVAFSITVDHLNMFRMLLNSRREPMNKNFRGASTSQGRSIFHVNPSEENQNVLLPGTVDPPDQAIIVNHMQIPPLDYMQAQKIFNKGDNIDDENKILPHPYSVKCVNSSSKTYTFCEGSQRGELNPIDQSIKYKKSTKVASEELCSYLLKGPHSKATRHRQLKEDILHRTKSQKRKYVLSRKNLERDRRLGMHDINSFTKTDKDLDMALGTVINKSYSNQDITGIHERKQTVSDESENNDLQCFIQEIEKNEEHSNDNNQDSKNYQMLSDNICLSDPNLKNKIDAEHLNERQLKPQEILKGPSKSIKNKSRLPVRTKGLQSSLVQYFSQSNSTQECKTIKSDHPAITGSSKLNNDTKKSVTTTIPKPIGKNAGKLEENCGIHNQRYIHRRPTSSPTKLNQQKK